MCTLGWPGLPYRCSWALQEDVAGLNTLPWTYEPLRRPKHYFCPESLRWDTAERPGMLLIQSSDSFANSEYLEPGHFCVTAEQVWCWGPRHRVAHVLHSQGKFVIHRGYFLWLAEIHPDSKQSKVLWASVWCHRGLYWFLFNIGVTTTVAQILRRDCAQRYQREVYDCSYVESKLARPEVFPAIVQFYGWSVQYRTTSHRDFWLVVQELPSVHLSKLTFLSSNCWRNFQILLSKLSRKQVKLLVLSLAYANSWVDALEQEPFDEFQDVTWKQPNSMRVPVSLRVATSHIRITSASWLSPSHARYWYALLISVNVNLLPPVLLAGTSRSLFWQTSVTSTIFLLDKIWTNS